MVHDPRSDSPDHATVTPLHTLAFEVNQLRHALPGIVTRLERVETTSATTVQRLEGAIQSLRALAREPSRPQRSVSPYPKAALPPSAEITMAGQQVRMPVEDAAELQKLAARIRWWRGTAGDVGWGLLRMAGKGLAGIAGGWVLHVLWELWQRHPHP